MHQITRTLWSLMMKITFFTILGVFALLTASFNLSAMTLEKEILKKDSELFEKGFNECDTESLKELVSEHLIFYHDQSGIQDKKLFLSNVEQYICSNSDAKPIRKLVDDSVETFPLYKDGELYGAIQQGEHEFYIRREGYQDKLTSTAKFNHLWLKVDGDWILENVQSYDHHFPDSPTIEEILQQNKVPALGIGVIDDGEVAGIHVYGERKKGQPANSETIFKVASLTKPIVAFVTLKLIDEDKLELDEPLYPYWIDPDLVGDPRHQLLTIRHVLTHQTGFDNWRWMSQDKTLKFNFDPGTQHQYSGEGFEYLRIALEHKFNQPFEALAKKYLFNPAGMNDTHFWWNKQMKVERYAHNYDAEGNEIPLNKHKTASAAANLLTTVGDYTRFLTFMMQQSNDNPDLYNNIIAKEIAIGEHHHFGLGWEIFTGFSTGDYALLHTGRDPGVNTLAIFFPKSQKGYVIFMNGENALPIMEHVLKDLYLGQELWQRR